jgi:hypothetical protein
LIFGSKNLSGGESKNSPKANLIYLPFAVTNEKNQFRILNNPNQWTGSIPVKHSVMVAHRSIKNDSDKGKRK